MIDDPDKALALVDKMEANLPIPARPTSALIRALSAQGVKIARNRELSIKRVFYMGDEGGISCDVTPSDMKNPIVCSITQIRMIPKHPLTEEIRAYQMIRKKRLAQVGRGGPPTHFTIKPRKKRKR